MADKVIGSNGKVVRVDGKLNKVDIPTPIETKSQSFNITASTSSLTMAGIEREPIMITMVFTSNITYNGTTYFVYNKNGIKYGTSTSSVRQVLTYKGTAAGLYVSDNDDTTKPYFVWDSENKTITLYKGNFNEFYGNYVMIAMY